jgi:hypothetical protein
MTLPPGHFGVAHTTDLTNRQYHSRTAARALGCGLAGVVILAIGGISSPAQAAYSYLTAYVFTAGIAVSAIFLLLIETLVAAEWFVPVRPAAEWMMGTLPICAVLFVPIAAAVRLLYPWVSPADRLTDSAEALVASKSAYLNVPFFLLRAGVYLACWIAIAIRIRRRSRLLASQPIRDWMRDHRPAAALALIVLALTFTFAAFDWIMSLSPTWFSTIFGVQIFSGAMLGCIGLFALLLATADPLSLLGRAATAERSSAVGKLMLTFVCLWAYVTFSQVLIIWLGDLPDEITWYAPRLSRSWLVLGAVIAVGTFAVPFALLLSREWKRQPRNLARLGVWLLLMHYAEVYWIVVPAYRPAGAWPHWTDLGAPLAVLGLTTAWASRGRRLTGSLDQAGANPLGSTS